MTSTEPRRTRQRQQIADHLAGAAHFQTAQQVYDALRGAGATVSLPTVYRTLAAMAEAGDLDVRSEAGQSAYRRCSPDHHHHLVCRGCGRTEELAADPVEDWAAGVAVQYGFSEVSHVTEISGLCPDCQKD